MEPFRSLTKDYRAAFSKDLNLIYDKYEKGEKSVISEKKNLQKKDAVQNNNLQLTRTMTMKNIH
jgi:hypothetical protein